MGSRFELDSDMGGTWPIAAHPPRFMGGGYTEAEPIAEPPAALPIIQTHPADDPRVLPIARNSTNLFQKYALNEAKTQLFLPGVSAAEPLWTPLLGTPVTINEDPSSLPLNHGYSWVNFEGAWMLISKVKDDGEPEVINYKMHSWLDYAPLITVSVEVRKGATTEEGRSPDEENIVLLGFYYLHKASTNEIDLWSLFFSPQKLGVSRISTVDVEAIRAAKPPDTTDADVNVLFGAFALVLFEDGDEVLQSRLRLTTARLVRLAVEPDCPAAWLEDPYVQMVALTEYLRRVQQNPRHRAMKKFLRTKRGFKFLRFIQVDRAAEKVLSRAATARNPQFPIEPWAVQKLAHIFGGRDEYLRTVSQMEIVSTVEVETDVSESFYTKLPTNKGKMSEETATEKIDGMFKLIKGDPGYGLDTASLVPTYGTVGSFFRNFWKFLGSQFHGLDPVLPDTIAAKIGDLELMRLTPDDFGLGPDPVQTLQEGGFYRLMGPEIVDFFGPTYFATLATAGSFFDWTRAGT
jgi:hypothetical protein